MFHKHFLFYIKCIIVCYFRLSVQAMKQFHPDVLASVQAKALYSKAEETLLGKIISVSIVTMDTQT